MSTVTSNFRLGGVDPRGERRGDKLLNPLGESFLASRLRNPLGESLLASRLRNPLGESFLASRLRNPLGESFLASRLRNPLGESFLASRDGPGLRRDPLGDFLRVAGDSCFDSTCEQPTEV